MRLSKELEEKRQALLRYCKIGEPTRYIGSGVVRRRDLGALLSEIDRLNKVVEGLTAALTPSMETKAAYSGEFAFPNDLPGGEGPQEFYVPWTTIKEIMAAIRTLAAELEARKEEE